MTAARTSPWLTYLSAAAEMRLVVQQNEDDYLFETKQRGRIVYLFDANVIHLFLNPREGIRHLTGFGGAVSDDDKLATTMITAEFMFSRGLSGQMGIPAFLSPGHADDLGSMVQQIQWNVARKSTFELTVANNIERIENIVHDARSERIDDIAAMRQLAEAFPALANTLFDGPPFQARQFTRLMKRDLVRPLALLPDATSEVLSPNERLIDVWARRIRAEIDSSSSHPRTDEGIRRDAETIVQLLLLNDSAKSRIEKTKYVLVTTDRALTRAYGRYFAADPYSDPQRYFLRQPHQYLPILNTQQMSRGTLRSELIQDLREAFDTLFPFNSLNDRERLRLIAAIADPNLADALMDGVTSPLFEQFLLTAKRRSNIDALEVVRKRWQQASQAAVVLNSTWLKAHFQEGWDLATYMIRHTHGMEQGILHYLKQILSEVESAHASFVAEGFLRPSKRGRGELAQSWLRHWDEKTSRLVASSPGFWEQTTKAERAKGLLSGREWQVLTWAADAAYRSGRWGECIRYTKRARSLLLHSSDVQPKRQEAQRHELHYLECAASRRLLDEERYQRTRLQMLQSRKYYAAIGDWYGQVRTYIELSRLELAYFVLSHRLVGTMNGPSSLGIKHYFAAIDELDEGLVAFRQRQQGEGRTRLLRGLDEATVLLHALDMLLIKTEGIDDSRALFACRRLIDADTPISQHVALAIQCSQENVGPHDFESPGNAENQRLSEEGEDRFAIGYMDLLRTSFLNR